MFSKRAQQAIARHREVKLSMSNITCLYFWMIYGNLCCCCKADRRLQRLYEEGVDRIEKEFDIVKIVSSLRNLKVYMKNKFMD